MGTQGTDEWIPDGSEDTFRRFMEDIPVGITVIRNDVIIYANRRTGELLQPFPENGNIFELSNIHKDDREGFFSAYRKFTENKAGIMQVSFRTVGKNQQTSSSRKYSWISCRMDHVIHKGMDVYLASFNDITPLKEMEEQIRVQDKMSTLGRMSSEIAHEVRNPLSVINLNTDSLLDLYSDNAHADIAGQMLLKIRKASGKIEKTVKRILTLSKPHKTEFLPGDINDLLRETVDLCSDMITRSSIKLELSLAEDIPLCPIDTDILQQIVINLVSNAVDILKEQETDRKIRISSVSRKQYNIFCVSDSGPGIPADQRELVFEPFYSTKSEGIGIGLSLCRRLVKWHSGSITAGESEWGGAEFSVAIPLNKGTDTYG